MIEFKTGDLLADPAEALVNPVNCVGVMGAGMALAFKQAFPANFLAYARACDRKEVQPGKMFIHTMPLQQPRYIINFPTKRHWRDKSRMEDVVTGLAGLVRVIHDLHIGSVAVPALGCGRGGLNWVEVKPLVVEALNGASRAHVVIYEPLLPPAQTARCK